MGYEAMAAEINRYTGGFSAAPAVEVDLQNAGAFKEGFALSSKALTRNIDRMFELALRILNDWDFSDHARVQSLIAQRTNQMINGLVQHGHSYASSLAARDFSPTSRIDEIYSGVHQLQFMKELQPRCQNGLPEILEKMNGILRRLLNRSQLTMIVIGEKTHFERVREQLACFVDALNNTPQKNATAETSDPMISVPLQYHREAWVTTTPVSYVAQCIKTPGYTHPDSPILLVLAELLRSGYLHGEIRERGGAYGGMTSYNADIGILTLLSYRDPHLARTLSVFNQAPVWLQNGRFDRQAVEEAILQTCSQMDTPLSPGGKAMIEYLHERKGKTKEMRQQFRQGVLGCTREDLIRVGATYLTTTPSVAAVTSKAIVDHNQSMLEPALAICPI
jgi:presequence protease